MLRRTALRLTTSVSRLAGVRCLSAGAGSGASNAELTKLFLELDATASPSATSALPIKLTGRSGELVEALWVKAGARSGPRFDAATTALEGLVTAIAGAGLVVDRFFSTANYSAAECTVSVRRSAAALCALPPRVAALALPPGGRRCARSGGDPPPPLLPPPAHPPPPPLLPARPPSPRPRATINRSSLSSC